METSNLEDILKKVPKRNREYWQERFEQLELALLKQGYDFVADMEREYKRAIESIEKDILLWYSRFAKENDISLLEAKRLLSTKELAEFRWTVREYIKYGKENDINAAWTKQLRNASARVHISRLEALKLQIRQYVEQVHDKLSVGMNKTIRQIYMDGYYRTAYEIQRGIGIGWNLHGLDDKRVTAVLSKPWAVDGRNFSERIWGNKEQLANTLQTELTQAFMRGDPRQQLIDTIQHKFNVSRSNAGRLVMTESAFFASASRYDNYKEMGVERYKIVATLDNHTSALCQSLDGDILRLSDWQIGSTAPPFHVRCRTTTVPYYDDNIGERAARKAGGKTYYVPNNITYPEWKKTIVK